MLVSNWSRDEMKLLTDVSVPHAAVYAFVRPQLSAPLSRPLLRAYAAAALLLKQA